MTPPAPIEAEGARGRGLDARTLSIAAIVGIGIGFAGLTAMSQFGSSDTTPEIAALAPVPMSAKASTGQPAGAGVFAQNTTTPVKEQSRLLPQQPALRGGLAGAGKTESMTVEAAPPAAPPAAVVKEKTVVASRAAAPRPPKQEAQPGWQAASPFFDDAEPPPHVLAYAPVERPAAPAKRSAAGNTSETLPADNKGPGTGKVNTAVNLRSAPDNGASVVAVLAVGTTVQIEKCDFWCQVVVDGKRGYVFRKFVGR